MKQINFFILLIAFFGISGCSTNKPVPLTTSKLSKHHLATVIDLNKLQSLSSITKKLSKYRTVFVGEIHTSYADHLNQLAVIKDLYPHWKQNTSIGLEMVQQPYQSYLDKYIAGEIDEREMLLGIEWYERWVYDYRLYRPIFGYARKNKIPLVALNIPKELTRRITKVGINGLSKKERAYLPAYIDRSDKNYVKRITHVFGQHSTTKSKGIEKFLDAQLAWDEGMAFTAAKYLRLHPKKRMILLAGGGHIISGEGIPNRLDRMLGVKSMIILNNIESALKSTQGDYLLNSREKKLSPIGRIGIAMMSTSLGVEISMLSPHGAAQKAGLKKGDIIIKLNDKSISSTLDLRLFMENTKPEDTITISFIRDKRVFMKAVKLGGNAKTHFSMHRK